MRLLAVDPDPNGGTWVMLDQGGNIKAHQYQDSITSLTAYALPDCTHVAVEDVQSYGMAVGSTVFDTVKNVGEIRHAARIEEISYDDSLTRPKIKSFLCHDTRAADANVRQALLDLYPASGGGATPQIGVKKDPGPLYGMKKDLWAALALGVVWLGTRGYGPLAKRDGIEGGTE